MKTKSGASKLVLIILATAVTLGMFIIAVPLTAHVVNIGSRSSADDDSANGVYVFPSGNDAAANGFHLQAEYCSGHNKDSGVYFNADSSGGKLQSAEVVGGYYAVCMETK